VTRIRAMVTAELLSGNLINSWYNFYFSSARPEPVVDRTGAERKECHFRLSFGIVLFDSADAIDLIP
jgi:hypothetical protein